MRITSDKFKLLADMFGIDTAKTLAIGFLERTVGKTTARRMIAKFLQAIDKDDNDRSQFIDDQLQKTSQFAKDVRIKYKHFLEEQEAETREVQVQQEKEQAKTTQDFLWNTMFDSPEDKERDKQTDTGATTVNEVLWNMVFKSPEEKRKEQESFIRAHTQHLDPFWQFALDERKEKDTSLSWKPIRKSAKVKKDKQVNIDDDIGLFGFK